MADQRDEGRATGKLLMKFSHLGKGREFLPPFPGCRDEQILTNSLVLRTFLLVHLQTHVPYRGQTLGDLTAKLPTAAPATT